MRKDHGPYAESPKEQPRGPGSWAGQVNEQARPLRTWSYSASQALRYQSTGHVERSEIPHQGIGKRDRESGLDYRLARFYDSDVGRFLSVDPLAGERHWLNPYNYVQNNPISRTDPTGALDDNYSVDNEGNVKLEEKTDDDYDMLYTKSDWDAGNKVNGLKVNDRSILPNLEKSRADFNGNYAISINKKEIFNVFYFMANNTNVEWGIDGYRTEGNNEYILRTSHGEDYVHSSTRLSQYNDLKMIFNMHSHPGSDGTRGGSGDFGHTYMGDMANISARYRRFSNAGMTNINTWFKVNDEYTVFPNHYVYHPESKNLYHFTPWESSIFIRKTNIGSDLHRNLGF